ncbi:sigma factor-like helix-turn-helix DNA-binding protein [Pontibacillus yanchengensis]|uniref:HNH nuclease domain-containing protein n=1 Tax=Pontibacillus yanchengensis Y32 TaxID=1385514 RepID=A0A0A2TBR1_9BACI|nr:sigma factor-like helix-turn-helix DNA-binding protein [Pontibacillus yanchengensis]KGP71516.1 hypothetical protein N782_18520 [Pontibacillus yanchengensis Y32]
MIRLNAERLQHRVELVKEYMDLEGSNYNLEAGSLTIVKKVGQGSKKASISTDGYTNYSLRDGSRGKSYTVYLHHIVMILADPEEYIKQMSEGMTINHKSGDKTDNSLSNLEYMTLEDNQTHSYINGFGLNNRHRIEDLISYNDAYFILRSYYVDQESIKIIAKRTDLTEYAVRKIVRGKVFRGLKAMFSALNEDARKSANSTLSQAEARDILSLYYTSKMPQTEIAKRYNISRSSVAMICNGARWREVYKEFKQVGA